MKRIIVILAGSVLLIISVVSVFLISGNSRQQPQQPADAERLNPISLDIDKNKAPAETAEPVPAVEQPAVSPSDEYKIINLSSNLSVMLMSSSGIPEYFPDDYLIGDLISFTPSALKKVINKTEALLASMPLGEYPDDLFHPQTEFYLKERLDSEIDRNNAPLQIRIGWPLTETATQINLPVKFLRRRDSAAGEIIFEKEGENWFIIDIAVDFAELTRSDSEVIIYDDLKFY